MSWILKSLVAKPEHEDDDDDIHQKKGGESGVVDDISQLKDSFTRQWKGFSSFLTGEDELPSNSGEGRTIKTSKGVVGTEEEEEEDEEDVEDDESEDDYTDQKTQKNKSNKPQPDSGEERPLLDEEGGRDEFSGKKPEKESSEILSSSTKDTGSTSISSSNDDIDPDSEEPSDEKEHRRLTVKGMRSDLAELSGTVKNQFSRFSSVMRVVTGDDLVKKSSTDANVDLSSNQEPAVKRDSPMLPFLSAGYSSGGGARGELEVFDTEVPETKETETGGKKHGLEFFSGDENENESLLQAAREDINALTGTLASGISGISKFASNFLPFNADEGSDGSEDGWEGVDDDDTMLIRDEIIDFANNVAMHPETWFEFPLPEEDADDEEFVLSEAQAEHLEAVEYAAPHLAALRLEMTPEHMSESRFWKIYFVLLCSKLMPEESIALVTPQVVEARSQVIATLQKRAGSQAGGNVAKQNVEENVDIVPKIAAKDDGNMGEIAVDETHKNEGDSNDKLSSKQASLPKDVSQDIPEVQLSKDVSVDAGNVEKIIEDDKPLEKKNDSRDAEEAKSVIAPPIGEESQSSSVVTPAPQKSVEEEGEVEVDDWLEDEDAPIASGEGAEPDDDVSFSDFEDEEDNVENEKKIVVKDAVTEDSVKPTFKPADLPHGALNPSSSSVRKTSDPSVNKKEVDSGEKLEEGSSPVGSEKAESGGWLTVDEEDAVEGAS